VQWEEYLNEQDWTWEAEAPITANAPNVVAVWEAGERDEEEVEVHEVDGIFGKRKIKGVELLFGQMEGI
jgi:hypothetical protein